MFPPHISYNVYCHDHCSTRGGSILMAIKNNISSLCISRNNNLELIWVRISSPHSNIIIGVCYRAPESDNTFVDKMRDALHELQTSHPRAVFFLFGDFNFPSINWSSLTVTNKSAINESKKFLDLTLDFNLAQVVSRPTRLENTLDLVFSTTPEYIRNIIHSPGLSDHQLLSMTMSLPIIRKMPTQKFIKDYNKGDFESINNELQTFYANFSRNFYSRSVEENWNLFRNKINSLINIFIPTVLIKSDGNHPWFDKTLKILRNKKKRMYRKAKRTGHVQDWDTHSQLSKEYAKNIKRAKEKFLSSDMPSILRSNPTRFWQLLSPKYHSQSLSLTDSNKDPIVENESATALNDFFISVFTDGGLGEVASPCSLSSAIMPPIVISSAGISALIDKLKLSSSAGMDNISTKILKSTNIVSSEYLSLIFSQSLSDRQSPKDWKIGKIIPVHKSGDRSLVSNYRPISLTSVPSKLLEHIISSNIISHLNSINFFYPLQHGFRKGLSCETQLAEFTHDLLVNMNNNYQTDVIFLDFAKAFDRVPHRHLLTKLSVLGIDSTIIAWIQDFLTSRVQFTLANNHKSPLGKVASGVPQGAGLSPLLFLIYINDLPHDILSKIRLFADDCVIYRPLTNDSDHLILQDDLTQINTWCEQWLMPLNLDKCKVV